MNNRTEILDAVRRRRPARIPYTYTALAETDARLRAYLKCPAGANLRARFGCNYFSSLWEALGKEPALPERAARHATADPNVRTDIWGVKWERKVAGSAVYFEITESPLAGAETVADIERFDWPRAEEVVFPDIPAGFDLQRWKQERVLIDSGFIGPFGVPWAVRGLEQFMLDLATAPAIVESLVLKVEEYTLGSLKRFLEKYPGALDLISCGDDYGSQNGLLLSTAMMRRFFMPSLKRHYDLARRHGVIGYHHCCGAIFEAIPLLIEAGVEVLNPIQTSAHGMIPERLKAAYGRDLCFHGGIDIQQTLVRGSPAEVRAEVRHRIETLGPEGYILAPSHVLQPDTPPENIVAMYEEAATYGKV